VRLRTILVCAAIGLALAAPTTAAAQRLQAFVLTSSPDSFADLQAHEGSIGVVYPTYFECSIPDGRVLGAPNPEVDAFAQANQLPELPRFNCQDGATVHRILTDPRLRASTLAGLVALAYNPSYRGLNLDLENDGPRDRGALSAFVSALAARLHARGRQLSVDVAGVTREDPRIGTGLYDDRALAAAADTVFAMAWGAHWEGSAPGPIAPLRFVARVARHLAALPHARRFVLGVPLYGLDWPTGPGSQGRGDVGSQRRGEGGPQRAVALQDAGVLALANATGATLRYDPSADEPTFAYTRAGVTHRVWYMDARAIRDRLRIARRYGLAAGLWRLGEEDQALWSGGL
jgi:spore germination protein